MSRSASPRIVEQIVLNSANEPVKYFVSYGAPLPPPRRRRTYALVIGVVSAVIAALVCVTGAAVYAIHAADRSGSNRAASAGKPYIASDPTAEPSPSDTTPPESKLAAALDAQAAAMVAGDQKGWMAP